MVDLKSFHGAGDLYFIRHGQSEGNRDGIVQGRIPSRLTADGRGQAKAAGAWFRDKGLDLILTSPLTRAEETARIIAAETGGACGVQIVEELTEIDTGIFSGLSFTQAQEMHPEAWRAFQGQSWEGVPKAERIDELVQRAEAIWSRLAALSVQGKRTVLCVSHGGFLQWIVRSTLGGRSWMPLFASAGNCCVSHLRVANAKREDDYYGHLATWMLINAPLS
jgi:broad specificity phosphatase PhoE